MLNLFTQSKLPVTCGGIKFSLYISFNDILCPRIFIIKKSNELILNGLSSISLTLSNFFKNSESSISFAINVRFVILFKLAMGEKFLSFSVCNINCSKLGNFSNGETSVTLIALPILKKNKFGSLDNFTKF